MAVIFADHTRKLTFCLLILTSLGMADVSAQSAHRNLSGNINTLKSYNRTYSSTHVSSVGTDRVTVDDATNFFKGDTVLLIQMQGVGILTDFYGNYDRSFGMPGAYEFLIVSDVSASQITFSNNILNAYDPVGKIQLVRVPYFNSATVRSKLDCDPWDGSKGGVLALIVGRSLTLEGDIDVSGLGFRGGLNDHAGDGQCQQYGTKTLADYYLPDFYNAGLKGEGNAIHDKDGVLLLPDKARGQGPNYTGGGGGNGRYSGGGGGANRGNGGIGGYEDSYCQDILGFLPGVGGKGGLSATYTSLVSRIFAGGGGGASTSASTLTVGIGAGGNGGGIVIIVTDTIISKGGKIIADGSAGGNGSSTGGAGGGGAGGAIAISLMSYGPLSNSLTLSAKGGNGGTNTSFGEGGGGGGGLIYVSKPTAPNVTPTFGAGVPNSSPNPNGEKKEDFSVVLNGFLFNSIRSSVTNNSLDSICSDGNPKLMTGTKPVGGTGSYTYQWQKCSDNCNYDVNWSDISGATNPEYDPGVDFDPELIAPDTIYYRRIVSDGVLIDKSKSVKFRILPYIKGNAIGADATICYNQDPVPLVSAATLTDGNGHYKYRWQMSADNSNFADTASNLSESFDPPALKANRWYHRIVTSGRCVNTSNSVAITVLPSITGNSILNTPPEICNGMLFDNLTGSKPAALQGGDNAFRYKWQGNINNAGWLDAPGTINQADYDPAELAQRVPYNEYQFRRVVYSGTGDVCSSTSNVVILKDYPVLSNNIISSPQTICSGSAPVKLTGTTPVNGNGTYTYTWQDSSKLNSGVWTNIALNSTSADYQPLTLTDTVRYRRIVKSSQCTNISKSIKIVVHKPLANYSVSLLSGIADTTICNGQNPAALKGNLATGGTNIPGDYFYQWKSSPDNATYTNITSATTPGFDPPVLSSTTYYKRSVTSGACTIESGPVRINVLPLISGNTFNQDQTICYNTVPVQLAANVSGGDGTYIYKWEQSADGGSTWTNAATSASYTPPALTIPMKYRRTVTSGLATCCSSLSNVVSINIHPPLPTAKIINTVDTIIFAATPANLNLNLTGTGPWKVTLNENSVAGSALTFTAANPVISIMPETSSGLSSFKYDISKVEDANGCLATSITGSKAVIIFNEDMFEFPEGFSPNHDVFNNTFEIKGLDINNLEAEMSIVNSAGTEVFHTSNFAGEVWTNWDGTNSKGSDLPEGTYYYLLKVHFPDSSVFRKSGFVILKRY